MTNGSTILFDDGNGMKKITPLITFATLCVSIFLSLLALSPMLVEFGIGIPTVVVAPIVLVVSFILSRKIKKLRLPVVLLLLVIPSILHLSMLYTILPAGWLTDQRAYFIDTMKVSGSIDSLKQYSAIESLYYLRYPIPWLLGLTLSLVTLFSPGVSLFAIYLVAYLCSLLFFAVNL